MTEIDTRAAGSAMTSTCGSVWASKSRQEIRSDPKAMTSVDPRVAAQYSMAEAKFTCISEPSNA